MLSFVKRLETLPEMQGEIAKHLRCHTCGAVAFTREQVCCFCSKNARLFLSLHWYGPTEGREQELKDKLLSLVEFREKGINFVKYVKGKPSPYPGLPWQLHLRLRATEQPLIKKKKIRQLMSEMGFEFLSAEYSYEEDYVRIVGPYKEG